MSTPQQRLLMISNFCIGLVISSMAIGLGAFIGWLVYLILKWAAA